MILEIETKQYIMIRVCGRASSSPHGQKAERNTERRQGGGEERMMEVWVPKSPSRSSSDLSSLRTFFKHTVTHSSLFLSEPGFIVYL